MRICVCNITIDETNMAKIIARNPPIQSPERYAALLHLRQVVERLIEEYGPNAELADILPDIQHQMKEA